MDHSSRLHQRMQNYTRSLSHLRAAVEKRPLSEIEQAGLVQFFEVVFELSWKAMKDYLNAEGYNIKSPRESIKTALDNGLIADGTLWMDALEKRNLAAHTYDETILDELEALIADRYYPMMEALKAELEARL